MRRLLLRLLSALRPNALACCLALCLLAAPALSVAAAPAPTPLSPYTVAIIPFYSPEKIWLLYTPFIDYLKNETSLPWELKLYPDHKSLLDDLCADKIGFALLGPVPMGRAMQKCSLKPFLVALNKEGKPSYHSVIVTADPAVTALDQVRGKKFGFFKGSTAAHIVPMKMLKEAGLDAEATTPIFLESQDRIMTALLSKEISAAGVKESLYRKFKNEPLRVLKTSVPLPNFSFCAAQSLPVAIRERFATVLLKLQPLSTPKDAETVQAWDDEVKNGFIAASQDYLNDVTALHDVSHEIMHED